MDDGASPGALRSPSAGAGIVLKLRKIDHRELPSDVSPRVYVAAADRSFQNACSSQMDLKRIGSDTWELTKAFPVDSGKVRFRFSLDGTGISNGDEFGNHIFSLDDREISEVFIHSFKFAVTISKQEENGVLVSKENALARPRSVSIKDLVLLGSEDPVAVESTVSGMGTTPKSPEARMSSRSIGTDPSTPRYEDHQGLFVNRSVGNSPKLLRISSDISMLDGDLGLNDKREDMPEATGAVAAAAVSERMLLPKERRQLAIVLVGLPARGKTFTAVKLTRYLRWLGHDTKHFNVGKYRRLKHGCTQAADFFRGDNQEGVDARNEVAILAMEDMFSWMDAGGQIGVFDATNSTKERRNLILKLAEDKCKVIFLETICKDQSIIDRNINLKIQQSPDYADQTDYNVALKDFKARLENYEKVYETVDEGSYIKMIDTVTGQGGQIQINAISGYLPGRIVFFLVNTHITPRPIFLTRHGESMYNLTGQIGGDPPLSDAGEQYAIQLASFIGKQLKSEVTASIWTSTLQRTSLTAHHIVRFPKVQWRALDEINAGICDGMTYEEIGKKMPDEYLARKLDKLRYRYPRGESYLDVIQRLEPVIIELERQRAPVVVIAHQAVLRSLYAYFADKPLKEIPHIEVPLHTVIEIQMGVTGIQEKRYKLMEDN
ncbi:6-phosphofructo-2-kinase/fructose-2,6-bisphosphatase [Selaginella moellendorffii]|nr:6-phosphofructo-2-kinase/fructose-2,6-bisphosphatase [Selaginella moellendorffii]|eukprot:XP_002991023.2 6-phosphofructo-2-kinase/fructose-2,6-bisphosphatase [Selaginella moellendorffii]